MLQQETAAETVQVDAIHAHVAKAQSTPVDQAGVDAEADGVRPAVNASQATKVEITVMQSTRTQEEATMLVSGKSTTPTGPLAAEAVHHVISAPT